MKFEMYKMSHILSKKINPIYLIYLIILLLEINLSGLFNPKFNKINLYEYLGFFTINNGLSLHFYFNLSFYSLITYFFFYYDLKYFSFSIFCRENFKKWLIIKILYNVLIIFILKFVTFCIFVYLTNCYITIQFNILEFLKDFLLITSIQILIIGLLLCSNYAYKMILILIYLMSFKFIKFSYHIWLISIIMFFLLFKFIDIKKALEKYSKN